MLLNQQVHRSSRSNGAGPAHQTSSNGSNSSLGSPKAFKKTVGTWGIALLTFFSVSGGPWGSEEIVSIAGPFPGFCMIAFIALFWSLPMCLITSELSSMLPHNGGYVLWVSKAFGDYWAFQDSFWSLLGCVVDNALYPVLAYETIQSLAGGHYGSTEISLGSKEEASGYWSKLFITILFSLPVIFSKVEWMTPMMSAMLLCLSLPFCVLLPYMLWTHPIDFSLVWQSRTTTDSLSSSSSIDWVGLVHVTFWNLNGFDAASTCAGEVINPGRDYIRGTLLALIMTLVTTSFPLLVAVIVNVPPWTTWHEGYWSAIARTSAGLGFALSVLISSLIGTFGMHVSVMWEDSWQLCGMAEQGIGVPRLLATKNAYFGNPINAMFVLLIFVCIFVSFDFRFLVMIDNFFSVSSKIIQILAYIKLAGNNGQYRPFRVPCLPRLISPFHIFASWRWIYFLAPPLVLSIFILLSTLWDSGWKADALMLTIVFLGLWVPFKTTSGPNSKRIFSLGSYNV